MNIREIGVLFGFELDRASERNVENKIDSLKSLATNVLGAIGITLSIKGIASAITSCVSLSSEVEEMENKFDVVFGNIRDEVDKWAESYADAVGRNKNDIKTYLADQQNLLVGFGMTREAGAKLSEEMTSLALDLASFGNMDEATSVEAMTKAVMGESEAAKTLGAVLNDSTRAQAMQTLGLKGTYDKLDQLTKMQVNYQAILSQSPDAIGDCERSLGSYESTVRRFQSKLKEIKQLIGQFFMPTYQQILSIGAKGLTLLRDWLQKTSDFADKLGGSENIVEAFGIAMTVMLAVMNFSKIKKMADVVLNLAKAFNLATWKSTALFIGILLLVLLIQDFIAFMRGDNSLLGAMLERAGVDCDKLRENILKVWENIKKAIGYIALGIKNVIIPIFSGIKDVAVAAFGKVIEVVEKAAPGIAQFFKNLASGNVDKSKFEQIGEVIGKIILTVIAAIAVFKNISSIIKIIILVISVVQKLGTVVRIGMTVIKGITTLIPLITSPIGLVIVAIMTLIYIGVLLYKNWDKIKETASNVFNSVKNTLGNVKDAVVSGFSAAIGYITGLPSMALKWGSDIISSLVAGIKSRVGEITSAVSGVAGKIKSFLHFSEPDEGPLADFHTYMPDMIATMANGIRAGKEKVKNALGYVTGAMSVMANANIVSPKTLGSVNTSNVSNRSITQNVNINNQFNGDVAGQQKSSKAMDKASKDATGEMARALQMG